MTDPHILRDDDVADIIHHRAALRDKSDSARPKIRKHISETPDIPVDVHKAHVIGPEHKLARPFRGGDQFSLALDTRFARLGESGRNRHDIADAQFRRIRQHAFQLVSENERCVDCDGNIPKRSENLSPVHDIALRINEMHVFVHSAQIVKRRPRPHGRIAGPDDRDRAGGEETGKRRSLVSPRERHAATTPSFPTPSARHAN
ncbi:MAG: hypothetical protein M0R03_03280 [Novosphingobium sp.]|nr:hypothetical protein [Novosphingobium sp.]